MVSTKGHPIFSQIKGFIFDVDGVLTDGLLYCFENGEQVRAFNIKDGFALKHALEKGYRVAIISGKNEPGVRRRLEALGITDLYLGAENKAEKLYHYLHKYGLQPQVLAYMGDDVPDLEVMQLCGLSTCPADACADVQAVSMYKTVAAGGKGAVRELIEGVMKFQKTW